MVNEKDFLRFGKKGSSKEDYTSAKKVAKHRICSKEKGWNREVEKHRQ